MAVDAARLKGKLIFTVETKNEFLQVVGREKFEKYSPFDLRLESALSVVANGEFRQITSHPIVECRDQSDVIFLKLALSANADCIVTGDAHLLELDPFHDIPILTPSKFLEWIKNPKVKNL